MPIISDIIAVLIFIMLIAFIIFYGNKGLLQDISSADKKPFSFSRVQVSWWTVVIIGSFLYIFLSNGGSTDSSLQLKIFNQTALILLGISAGTLGIGKVIDDSQVSRDNDRHQNEPSEGFLKDILSDSDGISIYRLQSLIFNLIYGLVFIYFVQKNGAMPDFSPLEMTLMGISSSTYIGLKATENIQTNIPKG